MQTHLAPEFQDSADGKDAEAILRKCVHCGFCNATCPTYQLTGDELDGPRGRIYLIKQVLEGAAATRAAQVHLDRCLTCRACETTCPSGVEYGHLADIGRAVLEENVSRPMTEKAARWLLKEALPSPLFGPALKLGQAVRGVLPESLKAKVPERQPSGRWPDTTHERKVLLLAGCVQPTMAPNINAATARVLDAAGIQTIVAHDAGCCGALKYHLNDQEGARKQMRANIDAWWPEIDRGVEAIVMNASGCGVTVKDYGHILKDDPAYAARARRVSELTVDLSELLPELTAALKGRVQPAPGVIAYHPPCTLQHGQRLKHGVESNLRALGFDVRVVSEEAHMCCGSAGTYSLLQPQFARSLRDRKLDQLAKLEPTVVTSANIGCITHLQSGTQISVKHWIEVLDQALAIKQSSTA